MTTSMDPAEVHIAGQNAEHLSVQTAALRPQLQQSAEEGEQGVARTLTQGALTGCASACTDAVERLATTMDQQGQKLAQSADSTNATNQAVGDGLRQIHHGRMLAMD